MTFQPCVPIVFSRRSKDSVERYGKNILVQWKPDSSMLTIAVRKYLLFNLEIYETKKMKQKILILLIITDFR